MMLRYVGKFPRLKAGMCNLVIRDRLGMGITTNMISIIRFTGFLQAMPGFTPCMVPVNYKPGPVNA